MSIATSFKPAPPNYPRWYAPSIEGAFKKIHALVSSFYDNKERNFFNKYFKTFVGWCGFGSHIPIEKINIAETAGAIQNGKLTLACKVARLAMKHNIQLDQQKLDTIVKKDHLLGIL